MLSVIAIAAICWVGSSIEGLKSRVGDLKSELAEVKAVNAGKGEQLNRIEEEQRSLREAVNGLQVDVARLKGPPK